MSNALTLTVSDYESPTRWRWVLTQGAGVFVADHAVNLNVSGLEYRGFSDLPRYLRDFSRNRNERVLLREVGTWMSQTIFGGLVKSLRARRAAPVTVIRVVVPAAAQDLVFRPFELARLDEKTLADSGLRFVYEVAPLAAEPGAVDGSREDKTTGAELRILAIFSLPTGQKPLSLRRERHELTRLLRTIAQTRGLAVELRVLQYGATRETLQSALEDEDGWDVVHFSGHGLAGELVLESARGGSDTLDASQL
jgi:hypothetical protein